MRFDNRFLPPLLVTSILVAAHLSFGILESYDRTAVAIAAAIGAELILGYATYGRWPPVLCAVSRRPVSVAD